VVKFFHKSQKSNRNVKRQVQTAHKIPNIFFENQDKQKSHSREKKGVFHGFQEQKGIHFCIIIVSFD